MKEQTQTIEQPETFTPGITKGMVRQHAFRLYRDKYFLRDTVASWGWMAPGDFTEAFRQQSPRRDGD